MSTFIKSTNNRCEASYRVAHHLGVAGKTYSDGELVKRCLIDVVKCIHPGKEADYLSLALSRNTIQRRQDDIAKQLSLSLQTKVNKEASVFSLAVDESTDIKDSAQLLIKILYVLRLQLLSCARIFFSRKHSLLAPVVKTCLLQQRIPALKIYWN